MKLPREANRIIASGRRWWQCELLGFLLNDDMRAIDAAAPRRLPDAPRRHVREWSELQEVFERVEAQLHDISSCAECFADTVRESTCLGTTVEGPDIDEIVALAKAGGDAYSTALVMVLDCVRTPWTVDTAVFAPRCASYLEAAFIQLNQDLMRSAATVRDYLRGTGRTICRQTAEARVLGDAQLELNIEFVLPYHGGRWVDLLEHAIAAASPSARAMLRASDPSAAPSAGVPVRSAARAPTAQEPPELPIPGFVYLMLNPAMPHLVMLGRSDIEMDWHLPNRAVGADRARRTHILVCALHYRDCYAAETEVERRLAPTRWPQNVQYFRVECHRAVEVMLRVQAEQDEPTAQQPAPPTLAPAPERVYMASWRPRGCRTRSISLDSVSALHALTVSLQTRHPTLALLYSFSVHGDIVYAGPDLDALVRADHAVTLTQKLGRSPGADGGIGGIGGQRWQM